MFKQSFPFNDRPLDTVDSHLTAPQNFEAYKDLMKTLKEDEIAALHTKIGEVTTLILDSGLKIVDFAIDLAHPVSIASLFYLSYLFFSGDVMSVDQANMYGSAFVMNAAKLNESIPLKLFYGSMMAAFGILASVSFAEKQRSKNLTNPIIK